MIAAIGPLLALLAGSALADPVVFDWVDPAAHGLSGIVIAPNGQSLIAITDRGAALSAALVRDAAGDIASIGNVQSLQLLGLDGMPLGPGLSDSEGLAIAADGAIFVAFEGPARVWRYATLDAVPTALAVAQGFAALTQNAALESLALGANGTLYTLPERSGGARDPFPVWALHSGAWGTTFVLPRRDSFVPTGADIGPDGQVYVLERDVLGIWFRSRIRRFSLDGSGEATVFESGFGAFDNLEGISIWQGPVGLRATLVSDDNSNSFQQTQLVEIDLKD